MDDARDDRGGNHSFILGLLTGSVIGAGLAIAFAPRLAAELRQRVRASADDLRHAASEGYRDVSSRIGGAVDDVAARAQAIRDDVTARGQAVRDDLADVVVRGAREVEQYAMDSKTVPGPKRT